MLYLAGSGTFGRGDGPEVPAGKQKQGLEGGEGGGGHGAPSCGGLGGEGVYDLHYR